MHHDPDPRSPITSHGTSRTRLPGRPGQGISTSGADELAEPAGILGQDHADRRGHHDDERGRR